MVFSLQTQCRLRFLPSDLFFNHLMGFSPLHTKAPAPWARQLHACQNCPCHFSLVSQSSQPLPQGLRAMANYPAAEPPPHPTPPPSAPTERAPRLLGGEPGAFSPSCVTGSPFCCLISILPSVLPLDESQTQRILVLEGTSGYSSRERKGQPASCLGFREVFPANPFSQNSRGQCLPTVSFHRAESILRHREGKRLTQGHQGLVVELGAEPRASHLSFHLLLGPPHLTSVSVELCSHT